MDSLTDNEIREIDGYAGYGVDRAGRVWTRKLRYGQGALADQWRELHQYPDTKGYRYVCFTQPGQKMKCKKVHRLVLESFVGPCPDGCVTCHWNGIRHDNRLENLRWDSIKSNRNDQFRHGTAHIGNANLRCFRKLTERDVTGIKKLLRAKMSQTQIACLFDVHYSMVSRIYLGRSWAHVA